MAGLVSVGYFLFSLIFNLAIFILLVRIILRFFRISSLHPFAHMIYDLTNPIIEPVEKLFKSAKRVHPNDWFSLGVLFFVELVKFILLGLLLYKTFLPFTYLILFASADIVVQLCNLLFYIILIRLILSWVNPTWNHPSLDIIKFVTNPLFALGRRIVPNISGFDFSPFIILIILKVITLFISASLPLAMV